MSDGSSDRLDDALTAIADHAWSCHKPELDAVQVGELLRVLRPVVLVDVGPFLVGEQVERVGKAYGHPWVLYRGDVLWTDERGLCARVTEVLDTGDPKRLGTELYARFEGMTGSPLWRRRLHTSGCPDPTVHDGDCVDQPDGGR